MKELKFKNCTESYKIDVDGVKIKPYLTLGELYTTYYDMMAKVKVDDKMVSKDALDRHFTKIVNLMKHCTNIDCSEMNDEEVYDTCAQLGLIFTFEVEIGEYQLLDRMIERDENTYNALTQIIEVIDKKLDGFDVNKIQEGLLNLGGELENVKGNK